MMPNGSKEQKNRNGGRENARAFPTIAKQDRIEISAFAMALERSPLPLRNLEDLHHSQSAWLFLLQKYSPAPILLTENKADGKTPTFRVSLYDWSFYYRGNAALRTILRNELLLDLDVKRIAISLGYDKDRKDTWPEMWPYVRDIDDKLTERLKDLKAPFYRWNSAGSGLHYSIYLDPNGVDQVIGWRNIRLRCYNEILKDLAQYFDISRVSFSSDDTLVRCEGGPRYYPVKSENIDDWGKMEPIVKSLLPEVPSERPTPTEAVFPRKIKFFKVPDEWFINFTTDDAIVVPYCDGCVVKIPLDDAKRPDMRWPGCRICQGINIDANYKPTKALDVGRVPLPADCIPSRNGGRLRPCVNEMLEAATPSKGHDKNMVVANEMVAAGKTDGEIHAAIQRIELTYNEHITERFLRYIRTKGYRRWSCEKIQVAGLCMGEACPIYEKTEKKDKVV